MKHYHEMEKRIKISDNYIKKIENELTHSGLDNRILKLKTDKMIELLKELGCPTDKLNVINQECNYDTNNSSEETSA